MLCASVVRTCMKSMEVHPFPPFFSDDPCKVFLETNVEKNSGRFVVFILWLKKQPFSFGWYALIRKNYSKFFEDCLVKLSL